MFDSFMTTAVFVAMCCSYVWNARTHNPGGVNLM